MMRDQRAQIAKLSEVWLGDTLSTWTHIHHSGHTLDRGVAGWKCAFGRDDFWLTPG
jgi:hypothetical protein